MGWEIKPLWGFLEHPEEVSRNIFIEGLLKLRMGQVKVVHGGSQGHQVW